MSCISELYLEFTVMERRGENKEVEGNSELTKGGSIRLWSEDNDTVCL